MIKKILLILLLVIPIRCYAITNVFHSNLVVVDDNISSDGVVKINVVINSNFNITGLSTVIEYDKSKLTIDEIEEESKFDLTYNIDYDNYSSYVSGVYNKGLSGEFILCSIIFRKTSLFVEGDTVTILLKDVIGSDDTRGITNYVSVSIPQNTNSNELNTDNSNEVGNDNVVIVVDNNPINGNTYVTNKEMVNVHVDVNNGRVLSGEGNVELEPGDNHHEIVVEDEDGNLRKTEINIIKEDVKGNIIIGEKKKKQSLIIIFSIIILLIIFVVLKKKQ